LYEIFGDSSILIFEALLLRTNLDGGLGKSAGLEVAGHCGQVSQSLVTLSNFTIEGL
jgi:hypothetical protein